MYLARFEGHHGEYIQAAALVASLPADAASRSDAHWDLIVRQLSAAVQIPRGTVAHRITLEPAGGLFHTIALTAPLECERAVREVIARLTRIEATFGGALSLPQDQRERDRWLDDIGSLHLCPSSETFAVGSIPLACDFRVADVLDDLWIDARVGGYALVYQLHMRAADVSPEWVRTARKSMLALRDVPGIPDALVERQDQLACGLAEASAFCEEYLCVETPSAARAVESLLADRFRLEYGPLGFSASAFRFEQATHQEVLAFGVHTHDLEPWPPVPLCGIAVSGTERDRLLSWTPSRRLPSLVTTTRTATSPDDDRDPSISDSDLAGVPRPCDGVQPFAFVSYKRQDFTRIAPILRMVEQSGIPVWYDRGIPGGAEWDDVIEDRVSRARFLMLFASNAAVASKYVRREVKFADALDVPILSVALEDTTLAQGLRMLLTQYQMLDARDRDFAARLRTAVMHLSSGATAV